MTKTESRAKAATEVKFMLTDFQVRQQVEAICASRIAPMRKARLLLRIGKQLNEQGKTLHRAKEQAAHTPDRKAEAGLHRMEYHTLLLHEDVLDAAFEALHPAKELTST